jgi:hypothetical protein
MEYILRNQLILKRVEWMEVLKYPRNRKVFIKSLQIKQTDFQFQITAPGVNSKIRFNSNAGVSDS